MNLLPHQIRPVAELESALGRHNTVFLSAPTGAGKTYMACELARRLNRKLIVVCPKGAIPTWEYVTKDFGLEAIVTNIESAKSTRRKIGTRPNGNSIYQKYDPNCELIKWPIHGRRCRWDIPHGDRPNHLIVFDEAHRLRNRKSHNGKLLLGSHRQRIPTLLVSATPFENPTQLYVFGQVLGLHKGLDFDAFQSNYGCTKGLWGWEFNEDPAVMESLGNQLYPERGSRLSRAELTGFQPNTITAKPVPVAQPKVIDSLWRALRTLEETRSEDADHEITEILRLRQEVELLKVPPMLELIKEQVDQGNSVFVAVSFRETLEQLRIALKTQFSVIVGKQSKGDRKDAIKAFQHDEVPVILATIDAGGESISLHDLRGDRPRVSIIPPTWSASQMIQALGRISRAGGKTPTTQYILTAANSVEDRILKKVNGKIDRIGELTSDDLRTW